ncbi:DNA repair exonuclease SbcCD ATPase subunit [Lachnospiraceae bacterium NE2001]|nr:DNA repair exonuclease SbcCD ATPase subunit [Lachnospiraceae bacterium NE2001]
MNIKSIKTRQFAGIKNTEVALDDGLNILVGKNETGKSTIIELIYQILYRNAKLDARKDKDFKTRFMPSDSKGDVVDGTLVFSTVDGEYTLQKKWGASEACELVSSDGTIIANEDIIREIIAGELVYKKGLYDDVVFASQKSQANVVEHILNKLDKNALAKQDLVSIIASEGMSSTEGIAPEDIEKKIQENIDGYIGNWDFTIDLPKNRRGIDNQWIKGNGSIIKAYYDLATLEGQLRNCEITEKAIDNDNANIRKAKEKLKEYQDEKENYERFAKVLASYKSDMELRQKYFDEQVKLKKNLDEYPKALASYGNALHLSTLVKAETIINQYKRIQGAKQKLDEAKKSLDGKIEITDVDEKNLNSIDRKIDSLQSKLSNLNLVANIKKLGNTDIQVKSVVTGKVIELSEGEFDINETVEITVPGIMSMTIASKGVDVEEIQKELLEKKKERDVLLSRCRAKDLDDLRKQKGDYEKASGELNTAQNTYNDLVVGINLSDLEEEFILAKENETELDDLAKKINELCGSESIDGFIAKQEQIILSIEEEYGKENALDCMNNRLSEVSVKLEKLESVKEDATNIPDEYLLIEDVDVYESRLKSNIENANEKLDEAVGSLRGHENELGDVDPDDLRNKISDARMELQKLKDDYKRWNHILMVLKITRDNMAGESTMSDVQDKFADYLSVITDGRIVLKFMDENMDVNIQSGGNHMNYEILSEGTKDTIALAFRLAMLDHLFPDGGGLVVFDDPFTEMDEDRTKQACKLVQKFADNGNQVIFVTCDNKYKELLSGNTIEM